MYLVSVPHFSMESPTCLMQCHQLRTSFSNLSVELFSLFSKPFYSSSFNFFITCEMNSFEMFLDSCKQPGVRQCQIWAVSRVWNNFKSGVYRRWIGFTPWGLVLLYWRNITFFPQRKLLLYCFNLLRVFTYVLQMIIVPLTMNDASVFPDSWV